MQKYIELTLESADGQVDCQVDVNDEEGITCCSITILYPHTTNGIMQSKVYTHDLKIDRQAGKYYFTDGQAIHPKVMALEEQVSLQLQQLNII